MVLPIFPSTALLDDFNRSDESPLSGGGNWPGGRGFDLFTVSLQSNVVISQATQDNRASRRWTGGISNRYGSDCEAWATVKTSVAAGGIAVITRLTQGGTSSAKGYLLEARLASGTLTLYYFSGVSHTQLHQETSITWAVGDKIGLRSVGTDHYMFAFQSGAWTELEVVSDSNEVGNTYDLGITISTQTPRLDDFGGGNMFWGQIIRHRTGTPA